MYGGVAAVTCTNKDYFAIPLKMAIQDGLSDTASWDESYAYRSLSHVVQMINNSYEAAEQMSVFLLSFLVQGNAPAETVPKSW